MLSQATTNDVLMTVIETINRYADIWHCMNSSESIVQTLLAAHQRWKENGIHNTILVSLLIRVDNGKYLDDNVRQQLNSEVAHYAQVCVQRHLSLPQLPEVPCSRRFAPLTRIPKLSLRCYQKSYFLLKIFVLVLHQTSRTVFGINTGHPLIGHGLSGTTS